MNLRHFSNREKKIAVFFVLTCAVYGIYGGIYRTALVRRQQIESSIEQARGQLLEQSKVIRRSRLLAARMKGDWESYRQAGSDEQVLSGILAEIESTAGAFKIQITEMKPEGVMKESFYNKFSVNLTMDAPLKGILAFIHALQGAEHHLMVSQLSLEKSQTVDMVHVKLTVNRILVP